MRKFYTLVLVIAGMLTANSAVAQSLSVASMDTVLEVNSSASADYGFHIDIENVTSSDVDVYVRRAYSTPGCAFDSAYFCWDYCYAADVDNSIGYVTVAAGATKTDFSGHVYSPNTGASCDDSTRYVFYTAKDPNDTLSVWVKVVAGPTVGTIELSVEEHMIYPNPAKNIVTIETSVSGEFLLYNTLGALVKKKPLMPGKNSIAVDELSNGVYLYSIDGSSFKRLIVSH